MIPSHVTWSFSECVKVKPTLVSPTVLPPQKCSNSWSSYWYNPHTGSLSCIVPTQIKCPFPSTQKVVSPTPLLIAVLLPCGLLFFQVTFPDSLVLPVPRALCQATPHHSVPCKSTGAMQLPTHPFAWPQSWNSDRDSSILFAFVSWRLANCLRLTVLYKYLKNEHMSNLTVSKL